MGEALRVLVVDDSAEDRATYRRHLARSNAPRLEFLEAATGDEGVQLCRDAAPDCVVLDFNLPDMDGLEFLELLHQEHGDATPAIVMLTGQGNEAVAAQAIKGGAQDYLVKGLTDATALCHAVYSAVEKVMLRRELEAQRAQLREADRRKDEFLATLAHELRNPLAPMRAAIDLLRRKSADPATVREALPVLERQMRHMVRLVDDLLDVSRITLGQLPLRKERVELSAVVADAVEAATPLIDAGSHRVEVELPEQPLFLEADATRLAQVLTNLLNNAAKYTQQGGEITLAAQVVGEDVVVVVRDTGPGIAEEARGRVFDLFTRVAGPGEPGGLGIGLALVKRLVEMHDGTVAIRTGLAGRGTEVVVALPHRTVSEAPPAARPRTDEAPPDRRLFLVVDDNKDAADMLARALQLLGADTQVAYDGIEALEKVKLCRPDAIVLDIGMPRLNGYDTARRLRQEPWGSEVLLIALTGWGQYTDKEKAAEAGFDRHFTKPIEFTDIEQLVAEVGRRGAEKASKSPSRPVPAPR